MFKLVAAQFGLSLVLACAAYVWGGGNYALSVLSGSLCYALPTALSAVMLALVKPYPALAGAALIGSSGAKTVLSLILMVGVFWFYPTMHFLSFLIGLLAVSHLVFLFFLKVYHYGSSR